MINPENINTLRVGQLPPNPFGLTDKIPHEIGTDLNQGTVQQLADIISAYIGSIGGLAFNPVTILDGQTLPNTTSPEWILVGKGTFLNVSGGVDITTTEGLNALVSNGITWSLGVEIPIIVDPTEMMISQTVNAGVTDYAPSEDAVRAAIEENIFLNSVGSFHYADLATQTTALTLVSDTPLKLTNDTDGGLTTTSNAPYGVSSVWNTTTNQFDFSQLTIGDLVTLRPSIDFTTGSANQQYRLYMLFGVGSGDEFELSIIDSQRKTVGEINIDTPTTFDIAYDVTKDYPAELYIVSDGGGTVKIEGWYIEIIRKNINIVSVANDETKEDVSNKQDSLAIDGTGTKYPTVDAVNAALPKVYTKTVFVNNNNPNSATIFDTDNPPTTNDDSLKEDTANLYIGLNSSAWVYNSDTLVYQTENIPDTSNFFINGTNVPAGNNKDQPINRPAPITVMELGVAGISIFKNIFSFFKWRLGSPVYVNVKIDDITESYDTQFPNKTGGLPETFAMISDIEALESDINDELALKLNSADYNDRFKGVYLTEAALNAAYPTANAGDSAQVNEIGSTKVINYSWDAEDGVWVNNGSGGSGATNTDALPEGTSNLYFTTARVLATTLTGLSAASGTFTSSDTLLVAFGKIKYLIDNIATLYSPKALVEAISFQDANTSIAAQTYVLELYSEYTYTINELKIISGAGTCTAAIKINSTNVTGISAVSVSSTVATGTASAANTVAVGDKITLVITSPTTLDNLQATIKTTRT